jgi:hypothetical protein
MSVKEKWLADGVPHHQGGPRSVRGESGEQVIWVATVKLEAENGELCVTGGAFAGTTTVERVRTAHFFILFCCSFTIAL